MYQTRKHLFYFIHCTKIFLTSKQIQESSIPDSYSHLRTFYISLAVWIHLKICLLSVYLQGFFVKLEKGVQEEFYKKMEYVYINFM